MQLRHAIIIPHYNDNVRLERCLSALMPQNRESCEILVVDNASTIAMDGLIARFPAVRFVTEPRKGAANARNRGVRETTAPNLFFLDADCIPAADWLAVAKRAVDRSDLVGGAVDVFDETPPPRSGAEAFEAVFAFDYKDYIERKGFSVTANLLTRRAVFEAVGDFIDGLSEDAEWCQRARAKGFRLVLAEDLRVGHPSRSDWPALKRKWRRISVETFELQRLTQDGIPLRLRWAARAALMLLSGPAHLPRIIFSPRLGSDGERLRGALTLLRLRALRAAWMVRQAFGPHAV